MSASTAVDKLPAAATVGSNPPPPTLYSFTTVRPSFLVYDAADASQASLDALPSVAPNFGLQEGHTWKGVVEEVRRLNAEAAEKNDGAVYKLIFLGRHGQGVHNVAEDKYGTQAWDDKYSFLNGDDEFTWGPDPILTSRGEQQAEDVNEEWRLRLHNPNSTDRPPLPERLYASPFTRALETARRTYAGLYTEEQGGRPVTLIMEGLRETVGGHTCDMRSPRSVIASRFPGPDFEIEPGFAEGDMLFSPITRETEPELVERLRETLSRIFTPASDSDVASAKGAQVIGITAHIGVMQAIFTLTGHHYFKPKTGTVIPMVLKAVPASAASA